MGNHCFKRQCNNFHQSIICLDSSFLWGARQTPAHVHIHTYGQFRTITYIYVDGNVKWGTQNEGQRARTNLS